MKKATLIIKVNKEGYDMHVETFGEELDIADQIGLLELVKLDLHRQLRQQQEDHDRRTKHNDE